MNSLHSTVGGIVRKYWLGYPPCVIDTYIARHVFELGYCSVHWATLRARL